MAVVKGVDVKVDNQTVSVKGPLGQLAWKLAPGLKVDLKEGQIHVSRQNNTPPLRAMHGLTRAELKNLVTGVTKGYERTLELTGVGYRAQIQGQKLTLNVGFAHPVVMTIPAGVQAAVDKQTAIIVKGIDKRLVMQTAANIRAIRPPDVYKQKGIKYAGEILLKKAGKTGKK